MRGRSTVEQNCSLLAKGTTDCFCQFFEKSPSNRIPAGRRFGPKPPEQSLRGNGNPKPTVSKATLDKATYTTLYVRASASRLRTPHGRLGPTGPHCCWSTYALNDKTSDGGKQTFIRDELLPFSSGAGLNSQSQTKKSYVHTFAARAPSLHTSSPARTAASSPSRRANNRSWPTRCLLPLL